MRRLDNGSDIMLDGAFVSVFQVSNRDHHIDLRRATGNRVRCFEGFTFARCIAVRETDDSTYTNGIGAKPRQQFRGNRDPARCDANRSEAVLCGLFAELFDLAFSACGLQIRVVEIARERREIKFLPERRCGLET